MMHVFVSDYQDALEVMRATAILRSQVQIDNDIRHEVERAMSKQDSDELTKVLDRAGELL